MDDIGNHNWLKGWREISRYIGRSRRTLQRWEKEGMPIMGDPVGRPIATKRHIDQWFIELNRENFENGIWSNPGIEAALKRVLWAEQFS